MQNMDVKDTNCDEREPIAVFENLVSRNTLT